MKTEPNVLQADIRGAYAVIAPHVRRTPLIEAASPIVGAPPIAALTPAWEDVAALAASTASLEADSPAAAIYPSRLAPLFAAATDYARVSFSPRRPIYEGAVEQRVMTLADAIAARYFLQGAAAGRADVGVGLA